MIPKKILIVGSGQMGGGIAQVMASSGFEVVLNDINREFIDSRKKEIGKNLLRQVEKNKLTEDERIEALSLISGAVDLSELPSGIDFVIEASTENIDIKRQIFKKLDKILAPDIIFASNTSSMSITQIAAATNRNDKVIGMHFFNPVPVMKLVEIILGIATSDETYKTANELALALNKTPAKVEDYPGFCANRIVVPMINEAIFALMEGVSSAEEIDNVVKLGYNHPMGPLALADLIGLDTILSVMKVLYDGYGDPKYRPCPLLYKYVNAGWLGRKSCRGFFKYSL